MKILNTILVTVYASTVDLDYFENTDVNFKAITRKKPKKGQNAYGREPDEKNVPKQKYLKVNDNRDRVADVLYFLLQNSLDSSNLPTYDQMLKYGCWCQLHDENWEVSNKGTPMDHLDNACRSWFKCYECIGMDEESCNGFNNRYGKIVYHTSTSSLSCENAGGAGSCKRNACECDLKLGLTMFQYAHEFDPEYSSENDFDPVGECVASGGGPGFQPNECCGNYPERFPFYSYDGTRGCCNGKTFDAENLVCCAAGHASVSCDDDSGWGNGDY